MLSLTFASLYPNARWPIDRLYFLTRLLVPPRVLWSCTLLVCVNMFIKINWSLSVHYGDTSHLVYFVAERVFLWIQTSEAERG